MGMNTDEKRIFKAYCFQGMNWKEYLAKGEREVNNIRQFRWRQERDHLWNYGTFNWFQVPDYGITTISQVHMEWKSLI